MKLEKGKVYLVGAGPGDTRLITVKGSMIIANADIVIYDELVNTHLFDSCQNHCKKIYAGKKSKGKKVSQDDINRLMVKYASAGYAVARVKGGDPYIFGRGGEEAEHLFRKKIAFEIIPGISSAVGSAAYAGIPLTDRNMSSSVTFVTGHRAGPNQREIAKWSHLKNATDTLVVFMGMAKLKEISKQLLRAGYSKDTPTAIVQWATWSHQKNCIATLENIASKAQKNKITSPAIFIIGQVVNLHQVLNWYQREPLFGKKIIITRASEQASQFKNQLEIAGANVFEFPTIKITDTKNYKPLDTAIQKLSHFDWIAFTSINSVDYFFKRLNEKHKKDARHMGACKVIAIGATTKKRLKEYGVICDFIPTKYSSKDLYFQLTSRYGSLRGLRFLLIRPQIAPDELNQNLKLGGAVVTQVAAYETVSPKKEIKANISSMMKEKPHAIAFTSSSTVKNLFDAIGRKEAKKFLKPMKIYSIGPVTTRTLESYHMKSVNEAQISTINSLVEEIRNGV